MEDQSMLAAYFSYAGHGKKAAGYISKITGADLFAIETVDPYPQDYNECAYGIAKEQCEQEIWPEIKEDLDPSSYDLIFLGTPAWWYSMAPAVKTWLSRHDFTGKVIVPIITHGGGGAYDIRGDIANLAHGATVLKPFVFYEDGGSSLERDLEEFISNLEL